MANKEDPNYNNDVDKSSERSKSALKSGVSIIKSFLNALFKKQIQALKTFVKTIAIKFGLLLLKIVIVAIPFIIIIILISDPEKWISMGFNMIVNITRDAGGKITGFFITELPGFKTNSSGLVKYVLDSKTKEEKKQIIDKIKANSDINTSSIPGGMNLDAVFGKYEQSKISKIIDYIPFVEDKKENFEKIKTTLEQLYKIKLAKKSSDWLIFDIMLSGMSKYGSDLKESISSDIVSKIGLKSQSTLSEVKEFQTKGMGYYRASSTSSGSKVPSMFVNIGSESQIGSATGGTIVQYSINPEKQNIGTLLEFLYKKNAIDSYLKIYKSSIDEFSNNDIIQLATLSSRTDVNKLTAEEKKINDLKVLLSTLESEYIDKLYAELGKTSISITNGVTGDDEIYKGILKRYVEKQYIFYSRLVNSGFVISFSSTSLMAQKDLDYDVCKVTQLYGYSLASDGYPNQLHNGYDFVYAKGGSREVTVRSIIDGTVVKSGKLMSANGYYIGNSVLIRGDDIGTDDSGKPVIPYVEYLHLSDGRMAQEGKKVSAGDPVGIQGGTASFPVHLHLSLFLSRQDGECNGALTSARGYSCAVKSDQFFRAIGYENILRNVNASCYEEWKGGGTIGRDW